MSHMPLWEAPSVPVTPARSRTKVTPHLCRATSIRTWSKARLRKVAYTAKTGCSAAGGQARRGDGAVLLGDADVVDPVREGLGELVQADRLEHGRGDGDDVLALLAELDHLLAEDGGPVGAGGGDRQAGVRVDLADARGSGPPRPGGPGW